MEAALSPAWQASERDRLAAEVAQRLWQSYGGDAAGLGGEGLLLSLEALVLQHLDDAIVRASLGLRYLEVLAEMGCRADYEDAAALIREAQWVEGYLQMRVRCPALATSAPRETRGGAESANQRREGLYQALLQRAATDLREAGGLE